MLQLYPQGLIDLVQRYNPTAERATEAATNSLNDLAKCDPPAFGRGQVKVVEGLSEKLPICVCCRVFAAIGKELRQFLRIKFRSHR